MQPNRKKLSKAQLICLVIGYIFTLNLFANDFKHLLSSIWVALALFILCLLIGLVHRYALKVFLALQILVASLSIFAKNNYKVTITEDILLSALTSETDLTLEMVSPKLLAWLFFTAILPILAIFFTQIKPQKYLKQLIWATSYGLLAAGLIFVIFWQQGYQFRAKGHIRDERFAEDLNYFSPVDSQYSLHRAIKAKKKMGQTYSKVEILSKSHQYQTQEDDLLVVLVIGESTRGDHLGINGYPKNTTPRLAQIDNLYSFKNATSCDTLTIHSVHCLSSPMKKSDPDRTIYQSSFGEIFQSLGYRTEIYSLQTLSQFYKYLKYDKLVSKYAVLKEQADGAKDKSLLPYAKSAIDEYHHGKKLVILHTLGSHQTYADRFDDADAAFHPYCTNPDVAKCQPQELINAYDNSVLGVDYLLASIIDELKDKKALLFYVSDHGESLGENGNYFHGKPVDIAPKEQFDIGFIVWLSDSYRQTANGQSLANNIQQHLQAEKSVSHDYVFHSLLGCAGISSTDGGIDDTLNICYNADN